MGLKVLVVGAGVGGLGLAQGLRRAGIDVRVFERDRGVNAHGYRLRIDAQGVRSLARCLPPELVEVFWATSNPLRPSRVGILDHTLAPLVPWTEPPTDVDASRANAITNSRTLRELLLAGLDGVVEYAREVVGVEDIGDAVRVHWAGGGAETGDVLVAADGIDSVVRGQVLPDADVVDTGLRGISGQAVLDAGLERILPESLLGGGSPIIAPDGLTLLVGVYQPGRSPRHVGLSHVADHVKWTLVGLPESLGQTEPALSAAAPERLRSIASELTRTWHPALVELVARSDLTTMSVIPIRAALPVPAWPTTRITLLGDAIHATTAVGGSGASLALRDAADLTDQLAEVAAGRIDLHAALARYEVQLREYGAAAALRSLRGAEQLFRVYIAALG
jgi:2-polyprenyl-6-methoxyphenol hydroxylase-like FAD-dependent oxidoreductase